MGTELVVVKPTGKAVEPAKVVDLTTWTTIASIAPSVHMSRLFPVSSPEAAMVTMLKGWELGLSLTASFEFISVVMGRAGLSPRGALALVLQSGCLAKWECIETPDSCEVYMERDTGFCYRTKWTMDDARQAGVVKNGSGWEHYPANMLRWRCIGFVIDVVFPDIINGMKRTDELGADLTPDGDTVLNAEYRVMPSNDPPKPSNGQPIIFTVNDPPAMTLDMLVNTFGVDKILEANEGRIPATEDEVLALGHKLSGAA